MSSAISQKEVVEIRELEPGLAAKLYGYLPIILPFLLALALIYSRYEFGASQFLYEGTLTMLALICYLTASVLAITNIFVKDKMLFTLSLITTGLGFSFNFSGWMIRWMEAGDAEGWKDGINGIWRYYPLDTLYALTLGFCCGAALSTLFIIRKPKYQFLGALSLPMTSVILTIAILLGNEIRTLMPILDSYWRPIHVTIATIGYGVCLVSFGLAFAYLLKDGIRLEAVAITLLLYSLLIYCTIGMTSKGYSLPLILTRGEYGLQIYFSGAAMPLRGIIPFAGTFLLFSLIISVVCLAGFIYEWGKRDEKLNRLLWIIFRGLIVIQGVALAQIFIGSRNQNNMAEQISSADHAVFGSWLREQMKGGAPAVTDAELASAWLRDNTSSLTYSLKSNPIEIGALISLFVCFLIIALFAWKREKVIAAMPSSQALDSMLYRSVSIAFPLLCMLLITGAVWANESWGRYWGWDPKETGALVATMAYAGFLHTRLAHGWRGRKSAYFALLGFALVIFTWLGVSYLLPGLHAYA